MRNKNNEVYKDNKTGKQYYGIPKQITIPKREDDIYILWRKNYNITLLSNKYYGDPQYYWVILEANNVSLQSELINGQKIRIPKNVQTVLNLL